MLKSSILHAALFTPLPDANWGLPILFEGEPGVAKTAIIRAAAKRYGLPCETLSPGERGEGAFGVVPVPLSGRLYYPAPDWTDRMTDGGLVFVDEVTSAGPALQPAMLGLIAGKRIGSHQLGGRVRVLGACNPPEQAANGSELSPPLANRFGHLAWPAPSAEEHRDYMTGQAAGGEVSTMDAKSEEDRVMEVWPDFYARAVGLETSFLCAQPSWKNQCPKSGDPAIGRSWPSDRTWEYATLALASAYLHQLSQTDTDELVTAFIGAKAYEAFATYIEEADLPNPGDVLDGKVKWSHDPRRLDRTAAVLNACTALVVPPQAYRRVERAGALWDLLLPISQKSMDMVVPAAQAMATNGLHSYKQAIPVLENMQKVLQAARSAKGK